MLIEKDYPLRDIKRGDTMEFFGTITFTKEAMDAFVKALEREEHG